MCLIGKYFRNEFQKILLQLQDHTEKFGEIITHLDEGIITQSDDGSISFYNSKGFEILQRIYDILFDSEQPLPDFINSIGILRDDNMNDTPKSL